MKIELDDAEIAAEMKRLEADARDLPKDVAKKVLPRVAKGARTELSRAVRKEYAIKNKDLAERVQIGRVKQRGARATIDITVKGGALPLEKFGAVRQTKRGLRVTVRRGKRSQLRSAFLANKRAMKRFGAPRLPIRGLFGPSVVQMTAQVWDKVQAAVGDRFRQELDRQMERHFRRLAKRNLRSEKG